MARKRKSKTGPKQPKALQRLERLARRRQDEKFLELAAQVPDLESAGFGDAYRHVFVRVLWHHLRRVDLTRVAALIDAMPATLENTLTPLPLTRAARAALAIDAGELDDAHQHLGSPALGPEASADRSSAEFDLTHRLSTLLSRDPGTLDPGPMADFHKLRRTLVRFSAGEIKRLPGNLRLEWTPARDTLDMARAVATVRPGQWLAKKNLRRLRQSARALLAHQPLDTGVETLASAAIQLARAAQSAALTMKLDHAPARIEIERWLELVYRDRSKLAILATVDTPVLLASPRQEITDRCRSIVTRLHETGGALLLARAHAAAGAAFDDLIEQTGDTANTETWSTLQRLLELEEPLAVARLLEESRTARPDVVRLTQLRAVELAFRIQAIEAEEASDGEDDLLMQDEEPPKPTRAVRQMLFRLRAISRQLDEYSESQRGAIAAFLRDRLADTFGREHDERFLSIAEDLLRHLPHDPILLLIAANTAVEDENRTAIARWTERIRQRGPAPETALPVLINLMRNPIIWMPTKIKAFHLIVEPLFGAAWPQARAAAARVLESETLMAMTMVLFAEAHGVSEEARLLRAGHLENLEAVRSIFGRESSFHVALVLTREIMSAPPRFRKAWQKMLAEHQDLEAAIAVAQTLEVLATAPVAIKRLEAGRDVALDALVHRLDERVSLWSEAVEGSLPAMDPRRHLRPLIARLRELLDGTTLPHADRQHVASHLAHAQDYVPTRPPRPKKTPKKRPAKGATPKRTPSPPAQLDLFGGGPREDAS